MNPEYKEYVVNIPTESIEGFESLMNYMPGWKIIADSDSGKNPVAVALGKPGAAKGASKGGLARARNLSPEQRSAVARKAANARWHPQQS